MFSGRALGISRRDGGGAAYKSKLSFQYGFSVLLETVVVLVCSPLMVATAKGSGNPGELLDDGKRGPASLWNEA